MLTSISGGARPAFSPHYSYFVASANGHQRAASFCHSSCSRLASHCCVCVVVHMRVTVTCVSALPSERHTNRWRVERPRAILWQKRFPSFVPRADGTDGLIAQHRPESCHHPSVLTNSLHKWAHQHLPSFNTPHHAHTSLKELVLNSKKWYLAMQTLLV